MDGHLEFLTINLQLEMAEGQMIVWYDNDNVYVNLVLNPTCRFLGSYQGISIVTSHDPQFLEESGHLTTSEEFPKKWSKCVKMCKHDKMIAQFYGYLWWIMDFSGSAILVRRRALAGISHIGNSIGRSSTTGCALGLRSWSWTWTQHDTTHGEKGNKFIRYPPHGHLDS